MTAPGRKLGALTAATWLVFAALVAPVGTATGVAAAANESAAAGNTAVVSGDVVYQTDSGLEVTDRTGANIDGNPFPDGATLALPGLHISAAGTAAVAVEQRTGTETRLSQLDADSNDVTVDPADKLAVTLGGGLVRFSYEDPTFEVAGVDFDFGYRATGTGTVAYPDSGLPDSVTIEAIATASGAVLDASEPDSGQLSFTLGAGTEDVNLSETDTDVPVASVGSDVAVDEDSSVSFDGSESTDDGVIKRYAWDFDDGSVATGQSPSHVFADPGTYRVMLTVTDGEGRTDTATRTVTVRDITPPTARTQSDTIVGEGATVSFDGSGSTDNGNIVSHEWDWTGDGRYEDSGVTATHRYADPGTYTATLRVTDGSGRTDTSRRTVTVADATVPTAVVGSNLTVGEGTAVDFDGSDSTDNVGIDSYEWDFGNGATATGSTTTFTYTSSGTYDVELTVTDGNGNRDTATRTITVLDGVDAPGSDSTDGSGGPTGDSDHGADAESGDEDTADRTDAGTGPDAVNTTTQMETERTTAPGKEATTASPAAPGTETRTELPTGPSTATDATDSSPTTTAPGPLTPVLVVIAMVVFALLARRQVR